IAQRRQQPPVDDSQIVVLVQVGLMVGGAHLDVVAALDTRQACAQPGVRQRSVLRNGFLLDGGKIVKQILVRVVVELIMANEAPQSEYRIVADETGPRRRNVESLNLRALVGWPQRVARRICLARVQNVVEAVGILEPGSGKTQVQLN